MFFPQWGQSLKGAYGGGILAPHHAAISSRRIRPTPRTLNSPDSIERRIASLLSNPDLRTIILARVFSPWSSDSLRGMAAI